MNTLHMIKFIVGTFPILITYQSQSAHGIDLGGVFGSWLTAYSYAQRDRHPQPSGNASHPKFRYFQRPNQTTSSERSPVLVLKHELEDEYHPEETTRKPSQEIDETKPDINCRFWGSSVAQDLEETDENSNINSSSKNHKEEEISKNVLPINSKRITIKSTIIKVATKYETIFPSCLKFEHVSRVCDGTLITLKPSPTATNNLLRSSKIPPYEVTEDIDELLSVSETTIAPSKTIYKGITAEPNSDYDYEFESLDLFHDAEGRIKIHEATPRLGEDNSIKGKQLPRKVNLFHEHKYAIQSEVISVTKTMTTTDSARTATVVASNCIPRNIQIPLCTQKPNYFPDIPVFPIFYNIKI